MSKHKKRIRQLEDELQTQRRACDSACTTVAEMHAAAVGAVTGPIRGVVEDVADIRARMLAAEEALGLALRRGPER